MRGKLLDLLGWATLALTTTITLWPALWVLGPGAVLARMIEFTRETGAQPDEVGSFFAGQVSGDPGPLYYPVAVLFRLSPLLILGLVALALFGSRLGRAERARIGWLLVYVLGFALMMTLGSKKFDRYLLPIFPVLAGLAAVGLVAGWRWLWARLASADAPAVDATAPPWLAAISASVVLVLAAWPLVATRPYPLSYYNPLLGGGEAAQRMVMVGNGEGLDQAAGWLRAQPDAAQLRIAAHSWDILTALVPSDGEPLRDGVPDDADYIVTYGRRIQMQRWGPSLGRYLAANPPVHVVRMNGVEYVHIHPGPKRAQRS